jgi:hypothetical protein
MGTRTKWFTRFSVLVLAASIGLLAMTGSTASAGALTAHSSAQGVASPSLPGSPQAVTQTGSCGVAGIDVPDEGTYFDFTDACASHDVCYTDGGTEADRYNCDQAFLADMLASCDEMWPVAGWWDRSQLRSRAICYTVARLYYAGVRLFGGTFFNYSAPV